MGEKQIPKYGHQEQQAGTLNEGSTHGRREHTRLLPTQKHNLKGLQLRGNTQMESDS